MTNNFINNYGTQKEMISLYETDLGGNELSYVQECIKSGWISSQGKYVKLFEEMFSSFCGCAHGVAVSNGTVALHLALVALGIKEDDEVIVPNITFVATANPVRYCHAIPVFVDVDQETGTIDPEKIEEKITTKTKAIIPVHLYGHPCDMDQILSVAKKHNLYVIEDCAEAHGALYKGKRVGCFGDVGCFSFYANKIIACGEGGMVMTNNKALFERLKFLRNQGMHPERKYWHTEIGFNYRMTNLQAAVGLAQCERIMYFIEKKQKNAQIYHQYLRDCNLLKLPIEKEWGKSVYWMYAPILSENARISRDAVLEALAKKGIETRPFFYPLSDLPPYKGEHDTARDFPKSAFLSRQGFNLPSSPGLSEEQISFIAQTLKEILR